MKNKLILGRGHQVLGGITFAIIAVAIYLVFMWVPADAKLGVSQKIFYFHVASAWVGFFAFFVVFIASVAYLTSRSKKWDIIGISSAEIGVLFTTIALITGSIWGRTAWNVWWSWEPRLVTTLILWFIYVAYLIIRASSAEEEKKGRLSAVFGIIGFFNVPIVFMSIRWWQSGLHPVVFEADRVGLPPSMLRTLITSVIAFTFLYFYLLQKGIALGWLREEVNGLKSKLREKFD
jgi:heme exporter protein C